MIELQKINEELNHQIDETAEKVLNLSRFSFMLRV